MDRIWASPQSLAVSGFTLVFGLLMTAAGWWLAPINAAQRAVADGRLPDALAEYRIAEARFARPTAIKRLLPGLYDAVMNNELSILYSLKQYDDVIDKAGATPTPSARFWGGCALFAKADVDISDKNRLNWMTEAQQEFRSALLLVPDDYDARFNYELVGKVIAGMKKDPNIERPKDLQLLTPSSAQAPRKVS